MLEHRPGFLATLCLQPYADTLALHMALCKWVRDMGREVDSELLVGAAEIAERLKLAQVQTVHLWRRRYGDFPSPIAQLRQALIWYWPDVESWAKRTGRL